MNTPRRLFLIDVDGVLTNLRAQMNPTAVGLSARSSTKGTVAYATGRAAGWLLRTLVPHLDEVYRHDPTPPALLYSECGSIVLERSATGHWVKSVLWTGPRIEQYRGRLREEIAKIPGVFFDSDKEIMISVEARHDMRDTQHDLVEEGLAKTHDLLKSVAAGDSSVEVLKTTYACDLVPRGLNKVFASTTIIHRLGHVPSYVNILGDSVSDLLLAEGVREQGIPYTMHFLGDPTLLTAEHHEKYALELPSARYDEGAIEVFRSL